MTTTTTEDLEVPPVAADPPVKTPRAQLLADAVYIGGPMRLQRTLFWEEATGALRARFAKHRVVVAGDGTLPKYGKARPRFAKAYVLVVPPDHIIGEWSYAEMRQALAARIPCWVYLEGELHDSFALRLNDVESPGSFGRVERCEGAIRVERPPKPQPAKACDDAVTVPPTSG